MRAILHLDKIFYNVGICFLFRRYNLPILVVSISHQLFSKLSKETNHRNRIMVGTWHAKIAFLRWASAWGCTRRKVVPTRRSSKLLSVRARRQFLGTKEPLIP